MKNTLNCAVVEYWLRFYATNCCTLCGNSGYIDSRGVKTAAGIDVGRVNYCVCPNGQTLRLREEKHVEP